MSDLAEIQQHLEAMRQRIAELEARANPQPVVPEPVSSPPVAQPSPLVSLHRLSRDTGLDLREVRVALEGVALALGDRSYTGREVTADTGEHVRRVAAAYRKGLTWADAFRKAGLPLPPISTPEQVGLLKREAGSLLEEFADFVGVLEHHLKRTRNFSARALLQRVMPDIPL